MSGIGIESAGTLATLAIAGVTVFIYKVVFRNRTVKYGWQVKEEEDDRGEFGHGSFDEAVESAELELEEEE